MQDAIGNYSYQGYGEPLDQKSPWMGLIAPALILGGIYLAYKIFGPGDFISPESAPQYALDAARRQPR